MSTKKGRKRANSTAAAPAFSHAVRTPGTAGRPVPPNVIWRPAASLDQEGGAAARATDTRLDLSISGGCHRQVRISRQDPSQIHRQSGRYRDLHCHVAVAAG